MEKLGLLAGEGYLPIEVARAAREAGYEVHTIALLNDCDSKITGVSDEYKTLNLMQPEEILNFLLSQQIQKIVMIGKVPKKLLFDDKMKSDTKFVQMISNLPDKKDDTIMNLFVRELEKLGIQVLDQTVLIKKLMPSKAILTKREPSVIERKDIEFGFNIAKELGRLDVGQTVVIKNCAVMALEAIEGTDACIERGGKLANSGAVVVKVSKPNQDYRFDVPAVGCRTLEVMSKVNAKVLAIEANRTLLVDRQCMIRFADENNITIIVV